MCRKLVSVVIFGASVFAEACVPLHTRVGPFDAAGVKRRWICRSLYLSECAVEFSCNCYLAHGL